MSSHRPKILHYHSKYGSQKILLPSLLLQFIHDSLIHTQEKTWWWDTKKCFLFVHFCKTALHISLEHLMSASTDKGGHVPSAKCQISWQTTTLIFENSHGISNPQTLPSQTEGGKLQWGWCNPLNGFAPLPGSPAKPQFSVGTPTKVGRQACFLSKIYTLHLKAFHSILP